MRTRSLPHVNQLGLSNGKASCVTMRCIVNKIILLLYRWIRGYAGVLNLAGLASSGTAAGTTLNRYFCTFTVVCVSVCVWKDGVIHLEDALVE